MQANYESLNSTDNQGTFRAEEGCHFSGLQEQDLCATLSEKEKENSSDQRTTLHSPGLPEVEVLNQKLNLTASSQAKQAPWPEPPDVPGHLEVLPGSGCYSCCICREVFEVKRDLAKHQRRHPQRQPYQHPKHRDKYRGNWELGRSPVLLFRKKRFQCSLITHQVVHTGQRPFLCPECGKTFRYKADLKKHLCLHQGERPFSCAECGKGFIQQYKLTEHIQVHKKPFQCLECDRSYCTWGNLKAHLHTHSGEKPFRCLQCGKSFLQKRSLEAHLHRHSRERSFSCDECGRSFTYTGALNTHVAVHAREKAPSV